MSEATEFVTAVGAATVPPEPSEEKPHASLRQAIDHATHFLPSQGPIRVFVHHNTLHAFEHEPFSDAVRHATQLFGCNPYLPEERYHAKLARGRILPADISAVLLDDLGDHGSALVGVLGTRFHLRLAMLQHPLQLGSDAELNWLLSETPALWRFRPEIDPGIRIRMVEGTRRWIMRDFRRENGERAVGLRGVVADVLQRFKTAKIEHWTNATWQAVTLHLLWEFCLAGARKIPCSGDAPPRPLRHRDWLLRAFGVDTDRAVYEVLIKFCAAFLDQGVSSWRLPGGERGFWSAFASRYLHREPGYNRFFLLNAVFLQGMIVAATITAFYAPGMALVQRDARRFFCYLLLSQSSLVLLGLGSESAVAVSGALCLWISITLSLTGFGVTLRALEARVGRLSLREFNGLYEEFPHLAVLFLLTGLASVGFPGTIGFVGCELLIDGTITWHPLIGVTTVLCTAFNGLAIMYTYFRIFTGRRRVVIPQLKGRPRERVAVLVFVVLIVGGGLYPQPGVASRFNAARQMLSQRLALKEKPSAPLSLKSRAD
jgi:hypothetical protein